MGVVRSPASAITVDIHQTCGICATTLNSGGVSNKRFDDCEENLKAIITKLFKHMIITSIELIYT